MDTTWPENGCGREVGEQSVLGDVLSGVPGDS